MVIVSPLSRNNCIALCTGISQARLFNISCCRDVTHHTKYCFRNNITTTVLRPLYRLTCGSRRLQLRTGYEVGAKIYCPHALADGNHHILVSALEFSSTVLSTLSSYH